MESKTLDAVEFRGRQRQQWDSAATGWRKWSELIDGAASKISERLVMLAGVEPGSRVLDVAAGYGEPSLTAAKAAGRRIRRFLLPGARMAISSWGPPDRVPFLAIPMRTAMERLQVPPPAPGTPGPLSRPTPEALGGLLETAGFSDVEVEQADVSFEWPSPEEFTAFIREIAPPITAMIDPHPQNVQDETWAAITEAIRQAAAEDGAVRFSNLVLLPVGRA